MNDDITEEEKENIDKYLMRALNNLCRIEKLLKGKDNKEEKNNYDSSK